MKPKHYLILIALLLIPGIFEIASIFVRSITLGRSQGKFIGFLVWLGLGVLVNYKPPRIFKKIKHELLLFTILAATLWSYGIFFFFFLANRFGVLPTLFIGTVIDAGSNYEYEATYLTHIHIPKATICHLGNIIGVRLQKFDTGCPVASLISFWWVVPYILGVLLLILLYLSFISKVDNYDVFFVALATYTAFVSMYDGGLLADPGQSAVGLLVFLFTMKERTKLNVVLPYMISSTIGRIITVITGIYVSPYTTGAVVIPGLYYSLRGKWDGVRKLGIGLLILGLIIIAGSAWLKNHNEQVSNEVYIYGIPPDITESEFLSKYPCKVEEAEFMGWAAYVKQTCSMSKTELENKLKQIYHPRGYLYVIPASNPRTYGLKTFNGKIPDTNVYRVIEKDGNVYRILTKFNLDAILITTAIKTKLGEPVVVLPWWG